MKSYWHLALEDFLERYESFGACQTESLNLVLEYVQKVVIVVRYDFYKNVVLTGGEVALHHFGDFLQLLNYMIELRGVAQEETNVCTGIVSYSGRVNKALRSFDYTIGNQALYPLVYCGTGYSAFTGDFKVGLTGVLRQVGKNPKVEFVKIVAAHINILNN